MITMSAEMHDAGAHKVSQQFRGIIELHQIQILQMFAGDIKLGPFFGLDEGVLNVSHN
jgi:hypothetical protein